MYMGIPYRRFFNPYFCRTETGTLKIVLVGPALYNGRRFSASP